MYNRFLTFGQTILMMDENVGTLPVPVPTGRFLITPIAFDFGQRVFGGTQTCKGLTLEEGEAWS